MLETFETVAKAVADPTRVRILKMLETGELCVCQITDALDLAPATVSKHLSTLKTAGLVQMRRAGKWAHYRLADRIFNPYAGQFLAMLKASLADDPTVTEDRRILAQIDENQSQPACGPDRIASSPTRCGEPS